MLDCVSKVPRNTSVMEKCLFTILIFTVTPPVMCQYYLIQNARNWTDAQDYCRENFDDLATVVSSADITNIQSVAQSQQFSSSAWIGLYTETTGWRWSLGNETLEKETQWAVSRPIQENRLCGLLSYYAGWFDAYCTDNFPFVCFDDRYTGDNRYIFVNLPMFWTDAQIYCRQHHTDLASSRNSSENSILLQALSVIKLYCWFGLYRETWRWSDQTAMSEIAWAPGKPDNALGKENCGYIYGGQFADAQCSNVMPFFCERNLLPKRIQILKLRVLSSQDVNYPALLEAILEKIKQKKQEHGLTRRKVKWKHYPNGLVFQKEEPKIV